MPKLVWRVKLVAELEPGLPTEVELARLERDEQAGLAELGLRLAEAKQLTTALQAERVPAQVAMRACNPVGGDYAAVAVTSSSFAGRKPQ